MEKQMIKNKLHENHHSFTKFISGLTNEELMVSGNDKWTAGQQLEHIYLSVKPLRQILGFPKFFFTLFWGKANRKSRSYEELINKYLQKLAMGGRATGRFIPKTVTFHRSKSLSNLLNNEVAALSSKLDRFTEDELDKYILPHPLLGKLTIREMIYFTIYHVEHHEELSKKNLK